MPIDTTVTGSPGWQLARLNKKLVDQRRQQRIRLLRSYVNGDAPLPEGSENVREVFRLFQRKARAGYAELVVSSVYEKINLLGFRTAASSDDAGDAVAAQIVRENSLTIELVDAIENALIVGEGYLVTGEDDGRPVITSEDPAQMVSENDPIRRNRVMRAMKLFHDDVDDRDFAYLYTQATEDGKPRVYRASRARRATSPTTLFNATAYEWDIDYGGEAGLPLVDMPVQRLRNRQDMGEFERHLDVLDRINHGILERLSIAAMQAFRQRAIKGDLPTHDDDGNVIDYDKVFDAGPAALWRLPEGVDIWESASADLQQILASVKDDVKELAAVTKTPMNALMPDAANQAAEGARMYREGSNLKAKDRIARWSPNLVGSMSTAFRIIGDTERADALQIEPIWAPVEQFSLTEQASAWAQLSDMPFETKLREIMQWTPEQIRRAKTEQMDAVVVSAIAAVKSQAAPAPVPPTTPPVPPSA